MSSSILCTTSMARKRRSPPSGDGAGPSRPTKSAKSTLRFSENATVRSPLELEAIIRKLNHKIEELETKVNEQEEKSNILQSPTDTSQTRSEQEDHGRYELRIIGAIKDRVYTGSKVEGKEGELLKVAIYYNGDKITSGPLASAKFEVLVVNGDFCASDKGSWSAETFQRSLVKARKEVGSILKDNYISQLSSGEAVLDGLIFIDNSSWAIEKKKWQLGIRLLESNKVRVLEAISNCFRVFDRHGKASEKPHPPLLTDNVMRLEKVGKKRASDLRNKKIRTVKDFLQLFHRNQSRLLKILGINSKHDESWKTMIGHAKECDVGSDLYSYRKNNSMHLLFFDSVYEVVGAEFGDCYTSFDKLPDHDKILVNKLKKGFYKDIRNRNFPADFKMVNGQPMPIEHNFTSFSTDDDAQQNDQIAGALDRQPADITRSFSSDSVPDIGEDADQNIVFNQYAGENYYSTQDENLSQVLEQESSCVPPSSTVEINSTSAHENMEGLVEEPYQGENMEGLYDLEDMTLHSPQYYHEMLSLIYVEQPILEDILYRRSNIAAKARSFIKVMCSVVRFKQYLRRDHLANNPFF